MSHPAPRPARFRPVLLLLPAALVALPLLLGGCEQRVVGTRNTWAGATDYELVENRPEPRRRGAMQRVGDFLFGWMRDDPAPETDAYRPAPGLLRDVEGEPPPLQ